MTSTPEPGAHEPDRAQALAVDRLSVDRLSVDRLSVDRSGVDPMQDLGQPPAAPLRHTGAGAGLLLAAAAALLVARAVLAPDVRGVATSLPFPEPPAVGSCVLFDETGEVQVVDCGQSHAAEVVATWPGDQQPTAEPTPDPVVAFGLAPTPNSTRGPCDGWVSEYIGWSQVLRSAAESALWVPVRPAVTGRLIQAPVDGPMTNRFWRACVAEVATSPLVTGSVRGISPGGPNRPPGTSSCVHGPPATSVDFVSCTTAHRVEVLGVARLTDDMMRHATLAVGRTADQVQSECVELARTLTGTSDPTYGGQLQVVAESVWLQSSGPVVVTPPGWYIPDCLIRVVGDVPLVSTMVGRGALPPPFAT